jgi:hypothetical protein
MHKKFVNEEKAKSEKYEKLKKHKKKAHLQNTIKFENLRLKCIKNPRRQKSRKLEKKG